MFKMRDNHVVWEDSSIEDVEQFKKSLFEEGEQKVSSDVIRQLNSVATKVLDESSKLSSVNKLYSATMNKIATDPGYVDIVFPVYGGLHIVKPALEAVLAYTHYPYKLIIVDDCSPDEKTKSFLRDWQTQHPEHLVISNTKNKGFSATVNIGIKAGFGKYVCLLNSDVLVTPNWLTKMVVALETDEKNAIVNPVTNNTALIAIPMHQGLSYLDMNQGLEAVSCHKYPEIMPTGFCFMFKRNLIIDIGYFDEAYTSYGEESDFWMKAISHVDSKTGEYKRYRAVLAENTYVFHERAASFLALGEEKHAGLRAKGGSRFNALWPQFKSWRQFNKVEEEIQFLKKELPERVLEKNSPYNIAFLVFSSGYCGGMAYIADVVNELQNQGVNAKVVEIKRTAQQSSKPTLEQLRCGVISFDSPDDAIRHFRSKVFAEGVVVSATNEMQLIASHICQHDNKLKNVLFSQSLDSTIAPTEEIKNLMEQQYHNAEYVISNAEWLDSTIKTSTKRSTLGFVHPGVNTDLFYPRNRRGGDERQTVAIFLSPGDPYRGFERGLEVATHVYKLDTEKNIRILGIGVDSIKGFSNITCVGKISQPYLANLLANEVDIVCDPQPVHTYGMPSLEGMASGAVPVCWDNLGIKEFATNNVNSIILPKEANSSQVAQEIVSLFQDTPKLEKMKQSAIKAAVLHDRKTSVKTFISTLEKSLNLRRDKKKIFVITPHLRKYGGPTSIVDVAQTLTRLGHDVTLGVIYAEDISPQILKTITVPITLNWQNPGEYDVVITNSDNPYNEHFSYAKWAKKKILLKLSHNTRFQQLEDNSLKLEWDAICTSSEWLKNACEKPLLDEGWTHPSRSASRIGWYHYGHNNFKQHYANRTYFANGQMNIVTLIHHHPSKGTPEALKALKTIKDQFKDKVNIFGVGEWPEFQKTCPSWMKYYLNLNRRDMAKLYSGMDFFLSASKTEGLGRMALEAMSASCLVILTPTQAEFAKDMENCVVAKGFEAEDLLEALNRLGNDVEIYKRIVKNGFRTAEALSSPDEYTDNWARLIQEL